MRNLRLIPIVLFATASLFVLKMIGLVDGEGSPFDGLRNAYAESVVVAAPTVAASSQPQPDTAAAAAPPRKRSWAQEVLGYPDVTGSIGKPATPPKSAEPAKAAKPPEGGQPAPSPGVALKPDEGKQLSAGERAVLDRLQDRRKELDARNHQLEIREGLVKAAEKRIEARINELKALEAQVKSAVQKKDDAEAARFKGVIAMYENMKPKDAARIFNRLDLKVLLEVASQIKPRGMSEILAQMSPDIAERLTVELATRANTPLAAGLQNLPKIQGKPRT